MDNTFLTFINVLLFCVRDSIMMNTNLIVFMSLKHYTPFFQKNVLILFCLYCYSFDHKSEFKRAFLNCICALNLGCVF